MENYSELPGKSWRMYEDLKENMHLSQLEKIHIIVFSRRKKTKFAQRGPRDDSNPH